MARSSYLLLLICSALVFAGRAYQYYFFGAPLTALFWDQGLMEPLVSGWFGREWTDFVTDPATSIRIERALAVLSGLLGLGVVGTVSLLRGPRVWAGILVGIAWSVLLLHAFLEMKDKFYHLAQFFEHGIQLACPLLLLLVAFRPNGNRWLVPAIKVAAAATFAAHGLYALGLYPVPGHFVSMTMELLRCPDAFARDFLFVVGWLDLAAAAGVFFPRLARVALGYMVVWGLATAVARVATGFYWDFPLSSLHQSLWATVVRLPHGLLPLVALKHSPLKR